MVEFLLIERVRLQTQVSSGTIERAYPYGTLCAINAAILSQATTNPPHMMPFCPTKDGSSTAPTSYPAGHTGWDRKNTEAHNEGLQVTD
jgi:hypothetical protein